MYRKKYGRSRRPVARKTNRVTPRTVKRIAKKVVNRSIEIKQKDLTYTTLGLSSISYGSGAIIYGLAASLAQGTADGQRIGNRVKLRGLRFWLPMQNGDTNNMLRLLFIRPKGVIGSIVPATWIQDIFNGTVSSTTQWTAPVNTERYQVMYDRTIRLAQQPADGSTSTVMPMTKIMKGFFKLNTNVQYAYDANTTSYLPTKEVYVLAISDSAAIPHPGAIGGFVRLYYQDA